VGNSVTLFIFCFSPTQRSHTHTHQPPSGTISSSKCFGCSIATNIPQWKWILQLDSAHQTGLETSLVAFLILGWWCFIDGWKCRPEFFTPECLCLLLNNHGSYQQMDDTVGFSASNRSRTNPQRLSNCSWNLVYWWVKISSLSENFQSRVFSVLAIAPQPKELWTNGEHSRIQRIK